MLDFGLSLVNITFNVFKSKERGYYLKEKDQAIYRNDEIVDKRLDLMKKSPLGLTWGYNGSGTRQAALAILADFTKDDQFSLKFFDDFAEEILMNLNDEKDHILKFIDVQNWVDQKRYDIN